MHSEHEGAQVAIVPGVNEFAVRRGRRSSKKIPPSHASRQREALLQRLPSQEKLLGSMRTIPQLSSPIGSCICNAAQTAHPYPRRLTAQASGLTVSPPGPCRTAVQDRKGRHGKGPHSTHNGTGTRPSSPANLPVAEDGANSHRKGKAANGSHLFRIDCEGDRAARVEDRRTAHWM